MPSITSVLMCFLRMQFNFTVLVYLHFYFIGSEQDSFVHDKKTTVVFVQLNLSVDFILAKIKRFCI